MTEEQMATIFEALMDAPITCDHRQILMLEIRRLHAIVEPLETLLEMNEVEELSIYTFVTLGTTPEDRKLVWVIALEDEMENHDRFQGATLPAALAAALNGIEK